MKHDFYYVVKIKKDGDGFMAYIPDVPGANTGADTRAEVIELVCDAVITAISGYMHLKKPIPLPETKLGPKSRDGALHVPAIVQAKILLWNEMVAKGVSKVEMAERMGKGESFIRRILDPRENSTWKTMEDAYEALDRRMVVSMKKAA